MAKFVPITGNEEENNSSQAPVQTQRDRSQEKQSQQERKTSSAKFVPFSEDQSLALSFGQQEFGEADISFSDRMSIAGGDNFAERRNIFLTRYPEGSFERVPGSGEEVFRRDPSESYRKFNPKGADLTDLAQITGEVRFPLLGEIAVNAPFMLTPQGAGASVVKVGVRTALGAIFGEETEQGIQSLQGVQEDPASTAFLRRPAFEGTLSLAGTGVASLISKSIDGLKGAGIFSLKPGAREAIRASERLGVEAPLPGQTTRSKIINRLQGQTGQTTPVIQDSIDRTNASLAKAIEDMSILSNSERQNAVSSLSSALEDSRFTFINALSSGRNLPKEQFGQFIQDSRVKYAKESQRSVNEAYNLARSYEEPSFDVSGLQETAKILARQTKVKTRTRTGETVQEAIPDGVDEVRTIADQIKRADPDSVGVEQLQAWEQQLFDLSQPDVAGGRVTEVNRKARELRGAVRDTFNNPTNKGPEFKQAWNNARSAAKTRFQTLDDSFSVQIGKTDRPSQIVDKIMNPSTLTPRDVDLLRRVSTDEDFIEIQGSFVDRLLAEPDKITASLKAFDDEALEKLLSPSQRSQLADLGNRIDQLDTLNIAKAASRQERFAPFVRDLVASDKQTRRVGDLFRFVEENGGKEGSLGRIIRTGLVEELYKKTTERISGETGRNVRAKAFQRTLDDFDERGLLQFFERTELANLRDIFTVAEFSDIGGEGVAGLIGAQTVSEATKGSVGAIYNLIRNFGIGNVLVSKGGRRLIQGVGNNISRRDIIIPATNALGRILLEDAKLGEDEGLPSLEDVENFLSGQTEED
jgi:hypothetical protein